MPCDKPAGPTTEPCGLALVHVQASRSRAREKDLATLVTSGLTGSVSSASAALQSSLESKLKPLLGMVGSTLFRQSWKAKITPLARPYLGLVVSALRTKENDSTLSQTTSLRPWASPAERDHRFANAKPYSERGGMTKGEQLNNQVVHLAAWPTIGTDSFRSRSGDRKEEMGLDQLARTAPEANWNGNGPARLTATGEMLTGSSAAMTSGGQLNPTHPRWLMGLPSVWDDCGVTAMQLLPRSRKRSSKAISTFADKKAA